MEEITLYTIVCEMLRETNPYKKDVSEMSYQKDSKVISLLDMIKCKLSTYRGGTRNHSKNNFQIAYDAISEAMEDYLNDFYSSFCFKQNAKKEINPNTELVCLCANCHRMVHRDKNQVLSVSNLRDILRENLKGEK